MWHCVAAGTTGIFAGNSGEEIDEEFTFTSLSASVGLGRWRYIGEIAVSAPVQPSGKHVAGKSCKPVLLESLWCVQTYNCPLNHNRPLYVTSPSDGEGKPVGLSNSRFPESSLGFLQRHRLSNRCHQPKTRWQQRPPTFFGGIISTPLARSEM